MSRYTPIDLSRLALPPAVEALEFEGILADMVEMLVALAPELAPVLALESEPAVKVLQVCAYREMLMRARVNDSVRAVHLATATGADLDNLVALFGVERMVVQEADPAAVPPLPEIRETDDALRARAQMAPEGFSSAGPRGAYEFHARSADGRVRDVQVTSPGGGRVVITVLSHEEGGAASADLLDAVLAACADEDVRPLSDKVSVQATTFHPFRVQAVLTVTPGPTGEAALDEARAELDAYLEDAFAIGRAIRRSALYAALHRPGVDAVELVEPAADVVPGGTGTARCTRVTLTSRVQQ